LPNPGRILRRAGTAAGGGPLAGIAEELARAETFM
jgi:hypothetical protein